MNEEYENLDTAQANKKVLSYFPEIFISKFSAYIKGSPDAYIGGDPNDPATTDFFNNVIEKELNSASNKANDFDSMGIDISRMFDQMSLVDDFLALEEDGKLEYDELKKSPEFNEARVKYILSETAKVLLTDDHLDLRQEIKDLLNSSIKNCYQRLIDKLMPTKPDMTEEETEAALANAKKIIVDNFMKAIKAVYAQKIVDLNAVKTKMVGWDMNVKSFADDDEKDSYVFEENKLTLFKVEGPGAPKYYIYGNKDGSNWQYTEINKDSIKNVDFNTQKTLPTHRKHQSLYDAIVRSQAHTISSEDARLNETAQQEYLNYYIRVVAPMELYNQAPITKDSFIVREEELESNADLLVQVESQREVIAQNLTALDLYKREVYTDKVKENIEATIKHFEEQAAKIERIDVYITNNLEPREEIKSFLLFCKSEDHKEILQDAYIGGLSVIDYDLINFQNKITKKISAAESSTTNLSDERTQQLSEMLEAERARILEAQILLSEEGRAVNIKQFLNSPTYTILKMQKPISDMSKLLAHIDEYIQPNHVADALKIYVQNEMRELGELERTILTEGCSEDIIKRVNDIIYSDLANVAKQVFTAQEGNDFDKIKNLVSGLPKDLQNKSVRLNAFLKLERLKEYVALNDALPNFKKDLNLAIELVKNYSDEELEQYISSSIIYETAQMVSDLDELSQTNVYSKFKTLKSISSNLLDIEIDSRAYQISSNIDNLNVYVSTNLDTLHSEDFIKGALQLQENLRSSDKATRDKALHSPIVEIAERYEKTLNLEGRAKEESLLSLNQDIVSLSIPKQQEQTNYYTTAQRGFKALFGQITGKINTDIESTAADNPDHDHDNTPNP